MKNQLYVHIGMPKTGTTYLQNQLLSNSTWLINRGYIYPDLNRDYKSRTGKSLPTIPIEAAGNGGVFESLLKSTEIYKEELGDVLFEIIDEYLTEYNVIISSENFWQWDIERFISLFAKRFSCLKIICYLRRQDYYFESSWNQGVKEGLFSWTFDEYMDILHIYEEGDYLSKLRVISKCIKNSDIIVRIYERDRLINKSIVDDFFDAIELNIDNEFEEQLISRQNRSIFGKKLNYRLYINKLCHNKEVREDVWSIARKLFNYDSDVKSDECYMEEPQRLKIIKCFKNDNDIISKEFIQNNSIFDESICMRGKVIHDNYSVDEKDMKLIIKLIEIIEKQRHDAMVNRVEKEIISSVKQLNNLVESNIEKTQELSNVKDELHSILESRSWKITKPLRKLDSFIHR